MDFIHLNLENKPREWNLAPQVSSVHFVHTHYPHKQIIKDWQIALHNSGTPPETTIEVNGIRYKIGYPHLIIKRPGDIIIPQPGELSSLYFKYNIDDVPEIPPDVVCCQLNASPSITAATRKLYDLSKNIFEYGYTDCIDTACLELMALLLVNRKEIDSKYIHDLKIREAASYLYTLAPAKIVLDKIARKFGFSRRNFNRCWKKEFGTTPGQEIITLKMQEAERLLHESSLDIGTIAHQLGYTEATNFIAAFRNHFGTTPLNFRNSK